MRVLVVHNRYRPAAPSGENAVVDQETRALGELGHQVRLYERQSEEIESWSRAKRVTLPAEILWSTRSKSELEREIISFAPDVIHLHNTFPLLSPSVLHAAAGLRVPVVAHLHNYKLVCANGELFRSGKLCQECLGGDRRPAIAHACYRGSRPATSVVVASGLLHRNAWQHLVSAYIFISAAQERILAPAQLPAERSFVRYNFVHPPASSPKLTAVAKRQQVAFVGRLDPAKGALILMDAWDRYRAERPDSPLSLVIIGSGPAEQQIRSWAGDRPDVRITGYLPRTEVAAEMAASLAALAPSAWQETFGMVVPEAFACGTGVIASAHGSFPELVGDDEGVLVPPSDAGALARAFVDVQDNPAAWVERGAKAQGRFDVKFGRAAKMAELLEIYNFAIRNPVWESTR